jgi:GH25 family lysozyme M1 (1,4-beta-N-acetylmuramidase)
VITFADVSHYQTVDLAAYKAAGYDRIVMKATGGATDGTLHFGDSTFATRWREAGRLGLARVAYHFARNNNTGGDEFAWCWSQIQAAGGMTARDVLCYDSEDNRSPALIRLAAQRAREFTAAAVRAGVTTGWIYSGKWYLDPAGLGAAQLPAGWRQLWISDYTPGQPDGQIEVPTGWARSQIVARQYTDAANLPGVPNTDANRVIREWLPQEDNMPTAAEVAHELATDTEFLLAIRQQLITALADPTHQYLQDELSPIKIAESSVLAKLDGLTAGGGQVDVDALAERVVAKLAARLAS